LARSLSVRITPRRLHGRWFFLAVPALLVTACGGGGTSGTTPTPSQSPTATTTPAPPTPSATPKPTALVVWVALQPDGTSLVRTVPSTGGTARTVATLPRDAQVLAAAGGRLAVALPSHSMQVIELDTGASATYPAGGDQLFGAAFSPDGTHLAFDIATINPMGGRLVVLDLASRALTTLRHFSSNHYDVPTRWTADTMAGVELVGFSDAGPQTLLRLDPTTGARTATTGISGSGDFAISADTLHAAVARHTAGLGDDNDKPGSQKPYPLNTLQSATIGSPPVQVLQQAHHQFSTLALSDDGGTICYSADSSTGGFAGISQDSTFGLFIRTGSTTTQLVHWDGSTWEHASMAGTVVIAANHTSTAEKLLAVSGAGAPATLDSLPGADQAIFVGLAGVA